MNMNDYLKDHNMGDDRVANAEQAESEEGNGQPPAHVARVQVSVETGIASKDIFDDSVAEIAHDPQIF